MTIETSSDYLSDFIAQYGRTGVLLHVECWQIISRNNDTNGNPYRLVLAYLEGGKVVGFEERSSSPNIVSKFNKLPARQLLTFHVSPSEYKETKKYGCAIVYQV
jgi:hypothetical protein